MKKHLILGAIENYSWDVVEAFFTSYKKTRIPNSECVMFVRNISNDTIKKLRDYNVVVLDIPSMYDGDYVIDIRWKLFSSFMVAHSNDYDMVLISDIRDVIIQSDIFLWLKNIDTDACLILALENDLISDSAVNKEWILRGYGGEVYNKICENYAICCGTVCGSLNEMIWLCDEMHNLIHANDKFWGMEQASLNYMVYTGSISEHITLMTSPALTGKIATVGTLEKIDIKGEVIINDDGSIPAIVHQYDRHPDLLYHVLKKYTNKSRLSLYFKYSKLGRTLNKKQRMIMKPIETKIKRLFR